MHISIYDGRVKTAGSPEKQRRIVVAPQDLMFFGHLVRLYLTVYLLVDSAQTPVANTHGATMFGPRCKHETCLGPSKLHMETYSTCRRGVDVLCTCFHPVPMRTEETCSLS